jgi:hypothetical protein
LHTRNPFFYKYESFGKKNLKCWLSSLGFHNAKTEHTLKCFGPKPQAYTGKMHENMKLTLGIRIENMDWEMCENTKKSTTSNIFKDQGKAINYFVNA